MTFISPMSPAKKFSKMWSESCRRLIGKIKLLALRVDESRIVPIFRKFYSLPSPINLKTKSHKWVNLLQSKQENDSSVEDFINAIKDEEKRRDSLVLLNMMQKASKERPKMWGNAIVGFGIKRYKSPASGREVDWFLIGFAPRKTNLSVYLVLDVQRQAAALKKLGKHKAGVGCLYINKLADVDIKVLEEMIGGALKAKQ